jgi:outer membrane protein assembly factor BamB
MCLWLTTGLAGPACFSDPATTPADGGDGTVNAAISVGHASVAQDFDPLRVLDIGGLNVLGFRNGVVAAFDPATFDVRWAVRLLGGGAPVLITDIAPADGRVVVTASAGLLGVIAAIDVAPPPDTAGQHRLPRLGAPRTRAVRPGVDHGDPRPDDLRRPTR